MFPFTKTEVPSTALGIKVFTLFDSAGSAYMTPFFKKTAGLAIRDLIDAKSKEGNALHLAPQDFTLYEIGVFDPGSGFITSLQAPVRIISLSEI